MDKEEDIKMNHNPTPTQNNTPSPSTTGSSGSATNSTSPTNTSPEPATAAKASPSYHRPSYKHLWFGVIGLLLILALVALVFHKTTTKPVAINSSQVSISSSGFFPKTIQVKAGSTVAWTNYDSSPHQVASDPYPKDDKLASLNSLALQPKDSFSYTFNNKGTYTYHDNLNPYKLQGTVMVR